jgi:hypothetical protein
MLVAPQRPMALPGGGGGARWFLRHHRDVGASRHRSWACWSAGCGRSVRMLLMRYWNSPAQATLHHAELAAKRRKVHIIGTTAGRAQITTLQRHAKQTAIVPV